MLTMERRGMKVVLTAIGNGAIGGGMGRIACEIAPALAKQHSILFVHPARSTDVSKQGLNLTVLQLRSSGEVVPTVPYFGPRSIRALSRFLEEFAPDVIHAQDPGPVSLLAQIWASKHNVPFVYTPHFSPTKSVDFNPIESARWLVEVIENVFLKRYYLDFLNYCDAVIVLNEQAKEDILQCGYRGKIFIIPNGRHLGLYIAYPFAKISDIEKRLLFVGDFCSRKNQAYLLEVMRYLPQEFVLDLVGSPLQAGYSQRLYDYARKNELRVNFVGKVDHSEIPAYLRKAILFVSASKIEVQSLAVLEALASGTPVVGLSNETIDEFADGYGCYRLPKETPPAQFAEKVLEICRLPQESYERLCQDARSRVAHLDWSVIVQRTTKAYLELISSKRATEATQSKASKRRVLRPFVKGCFYTILMIVASLVSDGRAAVLKKSRSLWATIRPGPQRKTSETAP